MKAFSTFINRKIHKNLVAFKVSMLLVFALILPVFAHPFYVSMTEIIFNEKEKSLQISVRIFTDDLEKALVKDCNCKIDLLDAEKHKAMEPILFKYLQKVLKISPNKKAESFQFVGFEKEEESIWTYLEIKNQTGIKDLFVENKILHQTKKKQTNLVRFKKDGFDKTIQLAYPGSMAKF